MAWELSRCVLPTCRAILAGWSEDDLCDALQEAKEVRLQAILPQDIIDNLVPALRLHLNSLPKDALVDAVIEEIEHTNSTSNGGHEIYIDKNGWASVAMPEREPVLVMGKGKYHYDFDPAAPDCHQSEDDGDIYYPKED